MPAPPITSTEKFLARVEQRRRDQCWWWTGSVQKDSGYPLMHINRRLISVARFAWEIVYLRGPIPAGMVITRREHDWEECPDRTHCIHRLCMNPNHMRLEAKRELDAERMRARNIQPRTHCRRNHPLTEDNVVWINRARNKRMCKICHDDWLARRALAP